MIIQRFKVYSLFFLATLFLNSVLLSSAALGEHQDSAKLSALEILKKMSDAVVGLKTFSIKSYATFEEVSSTNLKTQYHNQVVVVVRRPNALFAKKHGVENQALWYDGNTVTLLDVKSNSYATTQAPDNLDDFIKQLDSLGINAPLSDLFFSNLYEKLTENIITSTYQGIAEVMGIKCHHLVFRQEVVDWQLWIADDEHALPRKIVITSKNQTGSPQYRMFISDWVIDREVDAKTFKFEPPTNAKKIEFSSLTDIADAQ